MVSAVSLIGAAFAVGGSYFAVDTLRDVLIAKTITMPYATRMAIASAAALGGLLVISNMAAQDARKQTKRNLGKQLMNAEGYDHRKDGSWSRMVADTPTDTVMHQVDIFHDSFITDVDEAHRAAQRWLRKNENDRFDQIHYIIDMIDTGKWGMEYIALDTMDAEELTFHDWSDQEMMTHGKDDSFEDWVEHEIDSHGNLTLRDWADDEEESHIQRYGAESDDPSDMTCHYCEKDGSKRGGLVTWPSGLAVCEMCFDEVEEMGAETKVRRHPLDRFTKQRKPSKDSYRRRGRRSALRSMMAAEDDTVYMIETEYHSWDNWQNDCIAYDSFGPYATEAGAKKALKEMMEDEAERWTQHDDLRDPDTNEPMFTFGLDLDEYGNLEIKPSGMSLGDFTQKHTKTEHKGGRAFDGMTYSGVVVAKQIKAADSDDDDDDTRPIPDREPRRGAPDLWFAEDDVRQFTPQEAVEYLRSGDNCVWLIDYSDHNYGDDERPHYDYPIEDPDELETMIFEGVFEEGSPFHGTIIANGTSYDLDMWKDEPGGIHPSFAENPDWMKGMDEDEYADWANSWNSRSRGAFTNKDAEVFEAFSISDRPVSVKFGPGTSGNAKMKATFTDASGDTKTTQFGYKGMSDFTKHKDEGRRDSYLARHGSKGQNQNWKDPTTAGALSRYVLWEKTSLPAAKSAFKKRFNLRAEDLDTEDSYVGYQVSPFITETDRMAAWVYEPVYSDEDAL